MDTHKMTLLYFIICSLDIMNDLTKEEIELAISFVLNNAVIENKSKKNYKIIPRSYWLQRREFYRF
jgi:hypothetical protein